MENNLIDLLKFCFVHVFICIILFDTNAIYEYIKYVSPLRKLFKINDYIEYNKLTETSDLYINYIASTYSNFFIKLITCPLCLGFWINLVISLVFFNILDFFVLYCLSVMIYSLFKVLYYGSKY